MTEQEYYARIKAEYESSTDPALVEWARPYFDGTKKPNGKDRYIICPVSDRAARDIFELTGSDVAGFSHALRCDEVAHINKRHGKHGKADSSMRDISDLGRLAYVLNNYDEIIATKKQSRFFLNKHGKHADCLLFVKRINGQVVIAEAVTDSVKNKVLFVETVFKARTSAFSAQKKESTIDGNNPRPNVRNEIDSVTSILPQIEKNVNSSEEKSCDPSERRAAVDSRTKTAEITAEIQAELCGKSPREIAEMSRKLRHKNKQNGNNANGNGGKKPRDRGSSGR